jgi:hypothetical protein
VELCAHASGNKHGQPSGNREQSGVRVDPTGPVTMVRRGGAMSRTQAMGQIVGDGASRKA